MKESEKLDIGNLFGDLARELDVSLTTETGSTLNIIEFIQQEVDLGIDLTRNQLLVLKILYNCELEEEDLAILDYWKVAGKTTWEEPRTDQPQIGVIESGRRSGKSTIAALVAAYEFYFMSKLESPQKFYNIATSTPIDILCLATTATQAKQNIFLQIAQILRNSEYFKSLVAKGAVFIGKEFISYEQKGIYIRSGNSKSSSQVGGTLKCFILDEVSRFQDIDGKSNALELWSNIGISAAPFGAAAKLIAISSAWYENDAIIQLFNRTADDPNAVGFKLVSWDLNSTINKDNPIVASEYATNPDKAALEYEGIRPAAADAFFDSKQVNRSFTGKTTIRAVRHVEKSKNLDVADLVKLSIIDIDRRIPRDSILHIDPAISGDAYGLVYGHSEFNEKNEQIVIIDGLLSWKALIKQEVSITDVYNAITSINRRRPLVQVYADHYNSAETIQRLTHQEGIPSKVLYFSNRQQVMMYMRLKTLMAEDKLILPDDSEWSELLKKELTQLQFINQKKIDHPPEKGACFVGDTRIPLLDGTRPMISELVGKQVWLYSCDKDGNAKPGLARGRLSKYVTELVDVVLDNGAVVRCTPDHKFMVRTGEYVQAKDLIPNRTRLMHINFGKEKEYERISTKQGRILTHHMVVGKENIPDDYVVHHKNHKKSDNSPNNLLIVSRTEHNSYHAQTKHMTDSAWRKKISEGTIDFNKRLDTRQKRSKHRKSLSSDFYKKLNRSKKSFRSDITIDSLYVAYSKGADSSNRAATFLNCGRNVIVRVLNDNGFNNWVDFSNHCSSSNIDRAETYSYKNKYRKDITIESIYSICIESHITSTKKLAEHLDCNKSLIHRRLKKGGYTCLLDLISNGIGENHRVVEIIPVKLKTSVPVYDLEVDEWSNFALCAGVFVHNSKDLADGVASVAYYLSERIIYDASYKAPANVVMNKPTTSVNYREMTSREKALSKLQGRRDWFQKEKGQSKFLKKRYF